MNKAVFLDRDGTMIEDMDYLKDPSEMRFIPGSVEAIRLLRAAGYMIIVVSNQSGIARGFFPEDVQQLMDKHLQRELLKAGTYTDEIYYCPHHPEVGIYPYRAVCSCRKPGPGMIQRALKAFDIDPKASFIVGDRSVDIEAGKRAGLSKSILVLSGHGGESLKEKDLSPSLITKDLFDAAKWILSHDELSPEDALASPILCGQAA